MNRLSEFHREVWGLDRIVFRNQPLDRRDLPRVFAARDKELDRASVTVFDAPRNLLINGLFGVGKTVFIEALFRDCANRIRPKYCAFRSDSMVLILI